VSRRTDRPLDAPRLRARLETARALRERLGWLPFCRLVFGESDDLPGLVVDGYDDVLVAQLGTAGMEALRDPVIEALQALYRPRAVVLRNDIESRRLEGLECGVEIASGGLEEPVFAEENGARFLVSPLEGQKTGWYYDHRANRARLAAYVRDRHVLDCFSYSGAWGVQAALADARSVLCVDTSQSALATAARNAELNGVAERVATRSGDVFDTLKALDEEGHRFDIVVLDPPAFIRRKKDVAKGTEGYRRLNRLAMRVLGDDGLLVSASCSYHLSRDQHVAIVAAAGRSLGRRLQILERGHQAADHPVHPALPESEYLKMLLVRVVRGL